MVKYLSCYNFSFKGRYIYIYYFLKCLMARPQCDTPLCFCFVCKSSTIIQFPFGSVCLGVSAFCCALKSSIACPGDDGIMEGKEEHRCPAINTLRERERERKKGRKKASERERERETLFFRRVLAKW